MCMYFFVLIEIFRVQDLPLNEIGDLYLLDFVGPDGFIEEVSTKVQRFFCFVCCFSCKRCSFYIFCIFVRRIGSSYLCRVIILDHLKTAL